MFSVQCMETTISTNEMLVNLINTLAHYGLQFVVEFIREPHVDDDNLHTFFFLSCLFHICITQMREKKYNQAMSEQLYGRIYISRA